MTRQNSAFAWATERLWREFGEEVTDTVVVVCPSVPVEALELDNGATQLVLRNQCGMVWRPMDMP